ncbi:DNA polymerase Y family protein [Roseateles sp. DB2]|uniref:Y-family DNA polymerase n=1 Tax=Roseateles sp. DB2 TaxID=3453717 RepID=UPI003EEE861C
MSPLRHTRGPGPDRPDVQGFPAPEPSSSPGLKPEEAGKGRPPEGPRSSPGLMPRPHAPAPRSPHWLALLPQVDPAQAGPGRPSPQQQLAWWALQFTPRVCLLEEAVLLELSSCLRLFGGLRSLHERIQREGRALGLLDASAPGESPAMAWAPNALAALALARGGRLNGLTRPLSPLLDALPLPCLSAVQVQSAMLARLGCRRLGDVRRLPRAGLARRFGAELLLALDRAYGELRQAHEWVRLPERFEARLELPWRLDDAPALMPHAESLLRSCCAWLSGHHAGLSSLRLGWQHDAMRARDCPPGGELLLRSAELTRSFEHLQGLLREHLAQLALPAPVAELRLWVDRIEPLRPPNSDLRLDEQARAPAREPLSLLLQRCAVRLGPAQVCQSRPQADARPEAMQTWAPWGGSTTAPASTGEEASRGTDTFLGNAASPARMAALGSPASAWPGPQPSWLLEPPLRLLSQQERPAYQGELQLLLGPQRVEGGWWGWPGRALAQEHGGQAPQVQRDYYLARNPQGQLLWIFRARGDLALASRAADPDTGGPAQDDPAPSMHWYLHGLFA